MLTITREQTVNAIAELCQLTGHGNQIPDGTYTLWEGPNGLFAQHVIHGDDGTGYEVAWCSLPEVFGQIDHLSRIGVWTDPETGEMHLDATINVPDLRTALQMAREFNQKAVYDWGTKRCVSVSQPH